MPYIKYTGRRAETLKNYNHPKLQDGPYDFSSGGCEVSREDARVLVELNRNGMIVAEKPTDPEKTDPEKPPEKTEPKPRIARK